MYENGVYLIQVYSDDMENQNYEKSNRSNFISDDFDRFEFEEQDDLREFFEDSDVSYTSDLI